MFKGASRPAFPLRNLNVGKKSADLDIDLGVAMDDNDDAT